MTEAQTKGASPPTSDQQQANQASYNGQQVPYPPPGAYSPYYAYPPPPTDANGHPGDPNAAQGAYMMFPPPPAGMIYAYPPGQGYPTLPFPPGMPLPAALVRPKRKQVKMACTNCAAACKRCDEARPCERCIKYGTPDSCADGVRKERKKGIKRGPYKRKGKVNPETGYEGYTQEQSPPAEWNSGVPNASNSAAATSAAIQAAAQHAPPPDGYYPYFYPPPPGFVQLGPDGQPIHPDGTNGGNGQPGMPPHPQYYPLHPAAYPPFPPYGHAPPGAFPSGGIPGQMQMQQQQPDGSTPIDPAKTTGNGHLHQGNEGGAGGQDDSTGSPSKSKKRSRGNREDGEYSPKTKKARARPAGGVNGTGKKGGRKGEQNGEDVGDVGGVIGVGLGDSMGGVSTVQGMPM